MIKLSLKDLVETVMVTVIMIVSVDLVMTVAVTMVVVVMVGVHRVAQVVGIASSVENQAILLESAHLGMVGEVTDMVVEMIGMVAVVVMDLTVVVTDIPVVAGMVAATVEVGVTVTVVIDLVPIDGVDLEKYVSSRYEIYLLL